MFSRTFIFMCCLSVILLFSGCGKTKEVLTFQDFESEVYITSDDTEYKGTVIFDGTSSVKVTLTYPETVSGLEILCNSESTVLKKGDTITYSKQRNPVNVLKEIFLYPLKQTVYISDDDIYVFDGYSYKIESEENKPVHIKTDDYEYSFYSDSN